MSLLLGAVNALSGVFSVSTSRKKDVMEETPFFGASEWKTHLNLEVESLEIPERLLLKGNQPCPYWGGKLIKETHLLCLVDKNMDLPKLWEAVGQTHHFSHADAFKKSGDSPYWIWITKKPIPNTEFKVLDDQKQVISEEGYAVPKAIEIAIAILAGKFLGEVSLFNERGQFTKCEELVEGQEQVVKSDTSIYFSVSHDFYRSNGLAGVIR